MSTLILRGGRLWDGLAPASTEANVTLSGGHVEAVGAGLGGVTALDVSGCTVIPGLIEGHGHLCFDATPGWRATFDAETPGTMLLRMAGNARKMLEAGITTVRDLGAPTAASIELRDATRAHLLEGPRLLISGAPITTTGGHCWFMGGECDGEAGIRKAVREHVKAGVDWIKVMATGGNMTPRTNTFAPQFTLAELRACVEEARRLRRPVAAHAHGIEGIRIALKAGVDAIEHCSFTTPGGYEHDPALIQRIADAGTIISPTVSVGYRNWPDDGRREARAAILREQAARGCRLLMSTDCGIPGVPHEALGAALDVFAELAGTSPVETLKLATSRSAELLGLKDLGVIRPGAMADLLVVEGDPTTNLADLERVRYVLRDGQIVHISGR